MCVALPSFNEWGDEAPQHSGSFPQRLRKRLSGGGGPRLRFPAWGFSIPVSGSRTTGTGICSGPGTSSPTLDL